MQSVRTFDAIQQIDDKIARARRRVKHRNAFLPEYADRVKLFSGREGIFDSYGIEAERERERDQDRHAVRRAKAREGADDGSQQGAGHGQQEVGGSENRERGPARVRGGEIFAFFQPQIRLANGSLSGFEALRSS